MKLYEIMQVLNDNMDVEDNKLYDFILYGCSDYRDYLRNQSCKRNEPLKDREIDNVKYVLLAVRYGFKEENCGFDTHNKSKSYLQVYWAKNGFEIGKLVELNKQMGFGDCYVFRVKECGEDDSQ